MALPARDPAAADAAAAAAAAADGAAADAAAAPRVHTWADMRKHTEDLKNAGRPQPNKRHNDALKFFRWRNESSPGVPSVPPSGIQIPLDEEFIMIEVPQRDAQGGTNFYFVNENGDMQPWSWRAMMTSIKDAPDGFYNSSGVIDLWFGYQEGPENCDHHLKTNFKKVYKGVLPPRWDFFVTMSDGMKWRLHPRSKSQMDIAPFQEDFKGPQPDAGPGKSDGAGTYQRITRGHYDVGAAMWHEAGVDPKADAMRAASLARQKEARAKARANAKAAAAANGGTPDDVPPPPARPVPAPGPLGPPPGFAPKAAGAPPGCPAKAAVAPAALPPKHAVVAPAASPPKAVVAPPALAPKAAVVAAAVAAQAATLQPATPMPAQAQAAAPAVQPGPQAQPQLPVKPAPTHLAKQHKAPAQGAGDGSRGGGVDPPADNQPANLDPQGEDSWVAGGWGDGRWASGEWGDSAWDARRWGRWSAWGAGRWRHQEWQQPSP